MTILHMFLMLLLSLPLQDEITLEYTTARNKIERSVHDHVHYTLRWGNKDLMRALPDTFETLGLNSPYFWNESSLYLLLKLNRPHGRSSAIVLPLNDSSQVAHFNDPIAFNPNLNLLACIRSPRTILFTQLSSGKASSIIIPLPAGEKDLIYCINSATLSNTELHVHWVNTPPSAIKIFRIPKLKLHRVRS